MRKIWSSANATVSSSFSSRADSRSRPNGFSMSSIASSRPGRRSARARSRHDGLEEPRRHGEIEEARCCARRRSSSTASSRSRRRVYMLGLRDVARDVVEPRLERRPRRLVQRSCGSAPRSPRASALGTRSSLPRERASRSAGSARAARRRARGCRSPGSACVPRGRRGAEDHERRRAGRPLGHVTRERVLARTAALIPSFTACPPNSLRSAAMTFAP